MEMSYQNLLEREEQFFGPRHVRDEAHLNTSWFEEFDFSEDLEVLAIVFGEELAEQASKTMEDLYENAEDEEKEAEYLKLFFVSLPFHVELHPADDMFFKTDVSLTLGVDLPGADKAFVEALETKARENWLQHQAERY